MTRQMTELPQSFGPDGSMFGVLTTPDQPGARPAVAFLLFNAGVIPRLGPHRMNVKLARALAGAGEVALRFDLSGHGDSPAAAAGGDPRDRGANDLSAAMDHIEATLGIRRFALIGICSGAVNGYRVGLSDPRVAGLLMFDGFWYRSRWTRLMRDIKYFGAVPVSSSARGLARRVREYFGAPRQAEHTETIYYESNNPPAGEFSQAMKEMVERRVAVYVIYSGSVIDYYSYSAQFRHVFGGEPWFRRIRCEFRPDIDHSFLELGVQRQFIDSVLDWVPAVHEAAAS
jgi:pimeloyl-ACP methyl ester carboxylesterase